MAASAADVATLVQVSTSIILSAVQLWHERALGLESGQGTQGPQSPQGQAEQDGGQPGPDANGSTPGQGS